jgi:hypothetical protein
MPSRVRGTYKVVYFREFLPPEGLSVLDSASNEAAEPEKDSAQRVEPTSRTPRTDIQAVLNVLKRREEDRVLEKHRVRLDLRRTDLRRANLYGAKFREADLQGAFLQGANFQGANLFGAFLGGANLRGSSELTQEQIEWTIGLNETKLWTALPKDLNRPQLWSESIEEQTRLVHARLLEEQLSEH